MARPEVFFERDVTNKMLSLIVAMDEEGLIGQGNALPWDLPEEIRYFRKTTMSHTVIMGRVTWELLTKAGSGKSYLDGRVNFVVTRSPAKWQSTISATEGFDKTFGPHFVDTVELGVTRARREFPEFVEEIFILGGRQIYEFALRRNLIDRMIISHVRGKHIGDVYFPPFGDEWVGRSLKVAKKFEVIEYVKKP